MMKEALKLRSVPSSNFSDEEIPVEFLVLHYTACNLDDTLRIFTSAEKKVCAHFVIDTDGTVCDLGNFMDGPIRRGAHAGVSSFELDGRKWEAFNGFSIGIELVNYNGNLLSYPDAQYEALFALTRHLCGRFTALRDPSRVVGHEQIAGFRGKVDPGMRFEWRKFFDRCFHGQKWPERASVLDAPLLSKFEKAHGAIQPKRFGPKDWSILSSKLEEFVGGKR